MTKREFAERYPLYRKLLFGIARKLARSHPWLRMDLIQVGLIRLKEIKLRDVVNERAFITTACKFAMIDELRRLDPNRYVTFLDAHELGYQFVARPGGGIQSVRQKRSQGRSPSHPSWMFELNGKAVSRW